MTSEAFLSLIMQPVEATIFLVQLFRLKSSASVQLHHRLLVSLAFHASCILFDHGTHLNCVFHTFEHFINYKQIQLLNRVNSCGKFIFNMHHGVWTSMITTNALQDSLPVSLPNLTYIIICLVWLHGLWNTMKNDFISVAFSGKNVNLFQKKC